MKITVFGAGWVGTVTGVCLAQFDHDVVVVDVDPARIDRLAAGQLPFFEPDLGELLHRSLTSARLTFTCDAASALRHAEVAFLCVGTPQGAHGLPDLTQLETALSTLAAHLPDDLVIVNKSTVPIGSGNWTRTLIEERLPPGRNRRFVVASNPEFLREGSAIEDFMCPDRIVLGCDNGGVDRVVEMYRPILEQSFSGGRPGKRPQLFLTDLASAEMVKYAANAFLATKISFANEIANLCDLVGADAHRVLSAVGADDRIGPRFLGAGLGWGGSCFGKDVAALIGTGVEYGYEARLLEATVDLNRSQRALVVRKLQHALKVLKGRRIALLGLAFKPGTDDLRDAPALELARRFLAAGSIVSAFDPAVKALPSGLEGVRIADDAYDAVTRADAAVIATEWSEFADLDAKRIAAAMSGAIILDGRGILDGAAFARVGIQVIGIGADAPLGTDALGQRAIA
jgi:UDPglucose 6-dehydrogenase